MSDLFILGTASISESPKPNISSSTITLGSSLTYTGSEQTQTVTSVVLGGTTLTAGTDYTVTDNTAISAGTYTLSVIAQGDYDGVATASWTIAKAAGSMSLDKTELSLDTSNVTDTITVTRTGNGTISAQSSDTSVATVSVSGNVVTVTGVATGDATITINVAAGDNHLATSATASVSVTMISNVLAENSPAIIQLVAQSGTGSQYWSVGDKTAEINIPAFSTVNTSSTVCAFILGFNHNSSREGTGIHFQFGKTANGKDIAFVDPYYGNSANTPNYVYLCMRGNTGWQDSKMRVNICPAFLSVLPQEWQNVISECIKYSRNTSSRYDYESYITATTDKIWLLSEFEVLGKQTNASQYEQNYQKQYSYYSNGNSKIKYKYNDTTTACTWWLRSIYKQTTSNGDVCYISTSGNTGKNYGYKSYGFAPGFMVG